MLKDYEIDKPVIETDRLIIRTLNEADVPDLKEWLGRDEIYTYWGRKASKNEKNPELLFIDARPWVKRKPSQDFDWGIVLKESNKVIGMIAVFDIQNSRMGDIGYRIHPEYWNMGITTEALKEVVKFVFENTEIEEPSDAGIKNPVEVKRVNNPTSFIVTVLPPVLGPVISK